MKTLKKLAAVILSVAMLVTMMPTMAFAGSNLSGTFKDSTNLGLTYVVLDKNGNKLSGKKVTITYSKSTKKYSLHVKGEVNSDTVYMVKHAFDGQPTKDNLLYWCWYSNGSHVQAIATGAADPVTKFIKLTVTDDEPTPPEEGNPHAEPEYVPTFEIPIEKIDLNPGWDGDVHTGMGDASLGATYNLYRSIDGGSEELIDTITLDEWGRSSLSMILHGI